MVDTRPADVWNDGLGAPGGISADRAFSQPAQQRRGGYASKVLADGPLLMNPEALAQSPLENLPGAALGKLTC